ncbi:hypothetical protein PHLCEN_2v6702 [Hermanssonia centrifuga]|uniref:Uncharacterized protein n=1 Tax=Hermanssonia centrifuga TaxID=98765 RepID=A0A2R6NYQ9_9APHY|nr:hypothetical protein PHLCEN_2v6702 [Hermanssonia centrifuga]
MDEDYDMGNYAVTNHTARALPSFEAVQHAELPRTHWEYPVRQEYEATPPTHPQYYQQPEPSRQNYPPNRPDYDAVPNDYTRCRPTHHIPQYASQIHGPSQPHFGIPAPQLQPSYYPTVSQAAHDTSRDREQNDLIAYQKQQRQIMLVGSIVPQLPSRDLPPVLEDMDVEDSPQKYHASTPDQGSTPEPGVRSSSADGPKYT